MDEAQRSVSDHGGLVVIFPKLQLQLTDLVIVFCGWQRWQCFSHVVGFMFFIYYVTLVGYISVDGGANIVCSWSGCDFVGQGRWRRSWWTCQPMRRSHILTAANQGSSLTVGRWLASQWKRPVLSSCWSAVVAIITSKFGISSTISCCAHSPATVALYVCLFVSLSVSLYVCVCVSAWISVDTAGWTSHPPLVVWCLRFLWEDLGDFLGTERIPECRWKNFQFKRSWNSVLCEFVGFWLYVFMFDSLWYDCYF